jgi:hypothetical protein
MPMRAFVPARQSFCANHVLHRRLTARCASRHTEPSLDCATCDTCQVEKYSILPQLPIVSSYTGGAPFSRLAPFVCRRWLSIRTSSNTGKSAYVPCALSGSGAVSPRLRADGPPSKRGGAHGSRPVSGDPAIAGEGTGYIARRFADVSALVLASVRTCPSSKYGCDRHCIARCRRRRRRTRVSRPRTSRANSGSAIARLRTRLCDAVFFAGAAPPDALEASSSGAIAAVSTLRFASAPAHVKLVAGGPCQFDE